MEMVAIQSVDLLTHLQHILGRSQGGSRTPDPLGIPEEIFMKIPVAAPSLFLQRKPSETSPEAARAFSF